MKAFKKIKVMFASVFVASAVIVAGNAMASGFGHVDVVKEKDTFLLSEQVRIGTSIYGDDLSRPAGLYMLFNKASNPYNDLFNKYLTIDGALNTPTAIVPGGNFDVSNFNLDCVTYPEQPCILNFTGSDIGVGEYSITFFLADATKEVDAPKDASGNYIGNPKDASGNYTGIFMQDGLYLPSETVEFTIADMPGARGELEIGLHWTDYNDIDLHVIDPSGEEVYYGHKVSSASGGQLDVDSNAGCSSNTTNNAWEHIVWVTNPPAGEYKVKVNYFAHCNNAPQSSGFTVIVKNGTEEKTYEGVVSNVKDTIDVATITVQ